ncbi:MAG: hypothetical protein OXC54_02125, partial [Rhodospirillaceae bacterium]|nr:hypothetical protein [Rhodospirillaceae bacterium]
VEGSNSTPATIETPENSDFFGSFFFSWVGDFAIWQTIGKHFDSQLSCQETQQPGSATVAQEWSVTAHHDGSRGPALLAC